jgi:CRISPR-associated protein Cas2
MTTRHLVVSYDVTDDRQRTKLAKFLLGYCDRVQKSVFEGKVAERRLESLRRGVARLIDRRVDSVRLYTLCQRCQAATEVVGTGVYVEEEGADVIL